MLLWLEVYQAAELYCANIKKAKKKWLCRFVNFIWEESLVFLSSFAFLLWKLSENLMVSHKNVGATYCCLFAYLKILFSNFRKETIWCIPFQKIWIIQHSYSQMIFFFFLLVAISFISFGFRFLFFFIVCLFLGENNPIAKH